MGWGWVWEWPVRVCVCVLELALQSGKLSFSLSLSICPSPYLSLSLSISLNPSVFHVFHLPEPVGPWRQVPLHQRQPVLRTRQAHSTHQRPSEFTAVEPTSAWPEGRVLSLTRGPHTSLCAREQRGFGRLSAGSADTNLICSVRFSCWNPEVETLWFRKMLIRTSSALTKNTDTQRPDTCKYWWQK